MSQTAEYDVYLSDVSYFSGKFEAYCRYRQIPYNRIHADAKTFATTIYDHTGMMQVPVVYVRPTAKHPQGLWLRDSTPMIDWFEQQHAFSVPLMPSEPAQQFLHKLLEDFTDEWLWQPSMYWRWMFKPSAKLLGRRIAEEVMQTSPFPIWLAARYYSWRQKREWLYRDGMTQANQPHIAGRYTKILHALDNILQKQPYLSGNQPGLADIGFFGPFFRHFGIDPYPAEVMRSEAPNVYAWLARMWNTKQRDVPLEAQAITWTDFTDSAWQPIWHEISTAYLPYLIANTDAWQNKHKRFDLDIQGQHYPAMKTTPYRVRCWLNLQEQYGNLSSNEQNQISTLIGHQTELLSQSGDWSDVPSNVELPITPNPQKTSPMRRLKLMCFGTPRAN